MLVAMMCKNKMLVYMENGNAKRRISFRRYLTWDDEWIVDNIENDWTDDNLKLPNGFGQLDENAVRTILPKIFENALVNLKTLRSGIKVQKAEICRDMMLYILEKL